jgi:hypothetical protein
MGVCWVADCTDRSSVRSVEWRLTTVDLVCATASLGGVGRWIWCLGVPQMPLQTFQRAILNMWTAPEEVSMRQVGVTGSLGACAEPCWAYALGKCRDYSGPCAECVTQ